MLQILRQFPFVDLQDLEPDGRPVRNIDLGLVAYPFAHQLLTERMIMGLLGFMGYDGEMVYNSRSSCSAALMPFSAAMVSHFLASFLFFFTPSPLAYI